MTKTIKVALAGAGAFGIKHLDGIKNIDGVEVVSLVGRRLDVLFDKPGRRVGQIVGRSPYMQSVYAEGDADGIGAMARVEIVGAAAISLTGRIVAPASCAEVQIA